MVFIFWFFLSIELWERQKLHNENEISSAVIHDRQLVFFVKAPLTYQHELPRLFCRSVHSYCSALHCNFMDCIRNVIFDYFVICYIHALRFLVHYYLWLYIRVINSLTKIQKVQTKTISHRGPGIHLKLKIEISKDTLSSFYGLWKQSFSMESFCTFMVFLASLCFNKV